MHGFLYASRLFEVRQTLMQTPNSRQALQWMDDDNRGASVLLTAQRLIALEQSLRASLPSNLREGFAVSELAAETLTLTVYNTAFASKIRQFQSRFVDHLKADGWPVSEIRIRVSAQPRAKHATQTIKQARALDKTDLSHFETLATSLRPGPLADSVKKLLTHHKREPSKR